MVWKVSYNGNVYVTAAPSAAKAISQVRWRENLLFVHAEEFTAVQA